MFQYPIFKVIEQFKVNLFEMRKRTYNSDQVRASGVSQKMRNQNLKSLGGATTSRYNDVLKSKSKFPSN